jgi:MFS family permease
MYVTVRDRPATQAQSLGRRRVAPAVVGLGFVSLFTDISSESVAAILPLYLTGYLAISPIAYGFIDGIYQGVSAVVRIGAGWASDRGGHPKWVAMAGYGLSCITRVGLLFATGFAAITAVITIDRIGKGIRTAPRDAMIAAATEPDNLGHAFGVHRTLDTIGAVIGPLVAFLILWWIPNGFQTVFVVSLAFAFLGVVLLGLLVRDPTSRGRSADADQAPPRAFRWSQLADPRLFRFLVVIGVLGILTVGDGFIYLALLDRTVFDPRWFPLLYVGTNLAYLTLAVPVGRLADRVGRAKVLVAGHVALVAAYAFAAGPFTGPVAMLAPLVLLGAFYAATDGIVAAVASRLVEPSARASGIAAAQTVVAVARFASSVLFGVLWFVVGPSSALVAVGALLLIALPGAFRVLRPVDDREAVA